MVNYGLIGALLAFAIPGATSAQDASPEGRDRQYIDGGIEARAVSARVEQLTIYDETGKAIGQLARSDIFGAGRDGLEILAVRNGFVSVIHGGKPVWLRVGDVVLSSDVGVFRCGGMTLGQTIFAATGYVLNKSEDGRCMNSPVPRATIDVPFLPWPPPRPTHLVDVTKGLGKGGPMSEVSARLSSRLQSRGYDNLRYFSVPGGFAITTLVERFGDDGKPSTPRWIRGKALRGTSFSDYFRALISGEEGQFRMFALVVTNSDMAVSHLYANQSDVDRWEALGRPALSRELGAQRLAPGSRLWLMVYEFHPSADSKTRLVPTSASSVTSASHRAALGF